MEQVKIYINDNKMQILQIFKSMAVDEQLQATKVFSFVQNSFKSQTLKFTLYGKNYFQNQEHSQNFQTLIQKYYMTTSEGKDGKFYMYRIKFEFDQIIDILQFWLKNDKQIKVQFDENSSKKKANSNQIYFNNNPPQKINTNQKQQKNSLNQGNQYVYDVKDIPNIISRLKNQIRECQEIIRGEVQEDIKKEYEQKTVGIKQKINFLQNSLQEQTSKDKLAESIPRYGSYQQSRNLQNSVQSPSLSPRKIILSPTKIESTIRNIFNFHSKQVHLTGVKASFQRIQHQSNRMNYQKLVHFLRQYGIFPQKQLQQKKLHHIYVKNCSNTRDLDFQGFLILLQKLSQIVIQGSQQVDKPKKIKQKIIQMRKKNKQLINNPFHSLQKEDFRIDKNSLKYQFKLLPLNGKDTQQITNQLENRKKYKIEQKHEFQRQKYQKKVRYIKKLQSIDPFHPLVVKNKHLFQQKNILQSEPIASLENMEKYRDSSFDMKNLFGIQDMDEDLLKNIGNRKSANNRIKQIQKLQLDKMKNLMSGIIQRSNAKLEKLGISPSKRESNGF